MGKIEKRLNEITLILKNNKKVSIEYLATIFSVTDRTIKSDISKLRECGFHIELKNGIYIYKNEIKTNRIKSISIKDIRSRKILHIINEKPAVLDRADLTKEVLKRIVSDNVISYKTIERTIKELEDENLIYQDHKNKYNLSLNTEVNFEITKNEARKFLYYEKIYGKDFPFNKILKDVSQKIECFVFNNHEECNKMIEERIITLGRNFKYEHPGMMIMNEFEKLNYAKNQLRVEYLIDEKNEKISYIHSITFLYMWDKDKLYIVGKEDKDINNELLIINSENIVSLKPLNKINKYYMDKSELEKINTIFSLGVDGPYKVKVKFDNIYNIKDKLYKLKNVRKKSKITDYGQFLIYEDELYGLKEYGEYLRRFGKSCKVIEPTELKNIMLNTYEEIIRGYEE